MVRRKGSTGFIQRLRQLLGLGLSSTKSRGQKSKKRLRSSSKATSMNNNSNKSPRLFYLQFDSSNDHNEKACSNLINQSDHIRRLKSLEFIRLFLEINREEFFDHLINEENLCVEKTSAIYQMINEFLQTIQ